MINFIRTLKAISIILAVSFVVGGMIIAVRTVWKEDRSCNKVIFLKGELGRDINQVDYIANGMVARIYYCDSTTKEVPTSRIIKIISK